MFLLLFVSLAWGEDNREIRYQRETEIDSDAIDISGELVKPQGSLIVERSEARFNPLIELRMDFNPEISQSVNHIK